MRTKVRDTLGDLMRAVKDFDSDDPGHRGTARNNLRIYQSLWGRARERVQLGADGPNKRKPKPKARDAMIACLSFEEDDTVVHMLRAVVQFKDGRITSRDWTETGGSGIPTSKHWETRGANCRAHLIEGKELRGADRKFWKRAFRALRKSIA